MTWFERRPRRLEREQEALQAIFREGWVTSVEWTLDPGAHAAHVDIDFEAGGQLRQARLEYPFIYPSAPPRLVPRESGQRWSTHQWGTGELCLQIRADTWRNSFDGADILRSARQLLSTEGTVDASGHRGVVPSDHRFTYGQLLGSRYARLVLSDDLLTEVQRRTPETWVLDVKVSSQKDTWIFMATGVSGSRAYDRWTDPSIPEAVGKTQPQAGRIAVVELGDARYEALTSPDMPCAERWAAFSAIPFNLPSLVVGVIQGNVIAKFLGSDNRPYDVINILMDKQQRSPIQNKVLNGKRVAILGCGSMGSKVAASLARMGVENFFLVDSDVLHPGNLVRNELDWGEVGAHKVDGLTSRLQRINTRVSVDTWANHFGGQTSIDALMDCLAKLKACDLIVETTGSGQGFVYAASVSESEGVPMVWGRVFGGGFGGYIARSRPGVEAEPKVVRDSIYAWFRNPEHPPPPPDSGIDYAAGPDDQAPMIADDSDVSVISAHLTHFAADLLRANGTTEYPHSAYAIGLRKEWVFDQPFDTKPIIVADTSVKYENDDDMPSQSTLSAGAAA